MSDLRCADPACLDGDDGARWATHGLLCRRCYGRVERWLAEMPARRHELQATLGGLASKTRGENRPTKGTPPVPLNIAAHDQLTMMETAVQKYPGVLVSWVLLVCEERSLRGPDRSTTDVLAPYLLSQLDWISQQPWVAEFVDEMRDLTRTADGITASQPRWNNLPTPCPECGAHELGRWDGASQVQCASCDVAWPERYYLLLVSVLVGEWSVTAEEAAERASVEPATFRQWVSRGKVRRLGTVDGLARYSTEDIDRMTAQDIEEAS